MIQKCLYKFLSRIISELGLDFKDELSFTNRQIRYNIQENHKVTILYLKKIPYFTKAVLQEKGSNIHTHTATDPKHTNMNARTRARAHTRINEFTAFQCLLFQSELFLETSVAS